MATILCKKCGGTIEVSREQDSCECPYCGTIYNLVRNKNAGKSAKKPRSRAEILLKKYIDAVEDCDYESDREFKLMDKLKMEEIPPTLFPEIYSLATKYMKKGDKFTAIDLFSLLPDDFQDAQFLALQCEIERGWYGVEEQFKRVTAPEFQERKCELLLAFARKEEKQPDNFAHSFYKLLADCGNAEARAWIANYEEQKARWGKWSKFWWWATFIVAIALWAAAFLAGTQATKDSELPNYLCALIAALVVVSLAFPIYNLFHYPREYSARSDCNSRTYLTFFFDIFAAIIAYIAFRLGT